MYSTSGHSYNDDIYATYGHTHTHTTKIKWNKIWIESINIRLFYLKWPHSVNICFSCYCCFGLKVSVIYKLYLNLKKFFCNFAKKKAGPWECGSGECLLRRRKALCCRNPWTIKEQWQVPWLKKANSVQKKKRKYCAYSPNRLRIGPSTTFLIAWGFHSCLLYPLWTMVGI